jgi:hypothetical protein
MPRETITEEKIGCCSKECKEAYLVYFLSNIEKYIVTLILVLNRPKPKPEDDPFGLDAGD